LKRDVTKLKKQIMKTIDSNEPVEVFSGTGWHAGLVKSLLDDSEIEALKKET
jgi:hypothetical protein